jgi:hypothetical protein
MHVLVQFSIIIQRIPASFDLELYESKAFGPPGQSPDSEEFSL